eukprot:Skav204014  [mRNA]  locus=scaffold3441:97461:98591:- [translate_table: standard]
MKPDSATKLMLEWRELVSNSEEIGQEGAEIADTKAMMKFSNSLCSSCEEAMKNEPETSDESIAKSVYQYAQGLRRVASAKTLLLLVDNPKADVFIMEMVEKKHHPVAFGLVALDSRKAEIEKILSVAPPGVKSLLTHVSSCEAAASLLRVDLLADEALSALKTVLENLIAKFEDAVLNELSFFEKLTHGLQGYIKKYGPVADAAKSWAMDPVMKFFEGADWTKADYQDLHTKLDQIEANLSDLEKFAEHRSSNKAMVKLVNKAENTAQLLKSTRVTASEIGAIVMLSSFFIKADGMDLSTVLEFCRRTYKLQEDHLPAKISNMIRDAREKEKQEQQSASESTKKKVKKDKTKDTKRDKDKDKEEKNDKKEKKKKKN